MGKRKRGRRRSPPVGSRAAGRKPKTGANAAAAARGGKGGRKSAAADGAGWDPSKLFVFKGEGSVPKNVVRAEVHRDVKAIPCDLFARCDRLEELTLHEGLVRIGRRAFEDCRSLRSLRCPSTVNQIGNEAFARCWNLADVELPEGLRTIAAGTFKGCSSLRRIRIPSSVTRIGDRFTRPGRLSRFGVHGAFAGCTNLEEIELAEGLRTLGEYTFAYCSSLRSIRLPSSIEDFGRDVFGFRNNLGECSIQFTGLSERAEAIPMDDGKRSILDGRLRQLSESIFDAQAQNDPNDRRERWEESKRSLERTRNFLALLELKDPEASLELALWRARIEGGRGEGPGAVGDPDDEDEGERNAYRERCRADCGAGVVIPRVMEFFAYD